MEQYDLWPALSSLPEHLRMSFTHKFPTYFNAKDKLFNKLNDMTIVKIEAIKIMAEFDCLMCVFEKLFHGEEQYHLVVKDKLNGLLKNIAKDF